MHFARGAMFCVGLIAVSAAAQTTTRLTFDLERLELDPSAVGSLIVQTGRTLPEHEFRIGAGLQYENKPLVAAMDNQVLSAVIRDRLLTDLFAVYALTSRFELALQVPIVSYQHGDALAAFGVAAPAQSGLGTPRVSARVGLLQSDQIDLAAELAVGVPLGSKEALGGDGQFSMLPRLSAGHQIQDLRLSTQVGVLLRRNQNLGSTQLGSHFGWDASIGYTGSALKPELIFRTAVPFRSLPSSFELLAAARLPLIRGIEFFALGGPGFGGLVGTPVFRVVGGLAYSPSKAPRVGPCDPGQSHTPEECPKLDDDNDGILNEDDLCPLEKGVAEYSGCPMPDRDHDGIPDGQDRCPDEPGPKERFGCPFKDRDGDGVEDDLDLCPDVPGPAENRGCPIRMAVQAPTPIPPTPEKIVVTRERIVVHDRIFFDTGKTIIQTSSHELLRQLAGVINAHPEISLIRIEGHTDNRGGEGLNDKLSQGRADSVRQFLIENSVGTGRLEAKGYGLRRPIETNNTAAGRSMNRRVEFTILHSTEKTETYAPPNKGAADTGQENKR
jgi:outer membrane protein OmpA-like peptidoglycan-associated protein